VTKPAAAGPHSEAADYPMCVECKLSENVCMYHRVRSAWARSRGRAAARFARRMAIRAKAAGLDPNPISTRCRRLIENGLTVSDIMTRFTMFGTYQLMQREAQAEKA